MAFISISITKNHPLILGKGGFGRQLADLLSAEGWGEAEFLDDSAPGTTRRCLSVIWRPSAPVLCWSRAV